MLIIYLLAPLAVLFALAFLGAFVWSVRRGQLDDLDTPSLRILLPEKSPASKEEKKNNVIAGT